MFSIKYKKVISSSMSLLLAFLLGLLRREKGIALTGEKGIVYNLGICREMSDVKWKVEEK